MRTLPLLALLVAPSLAAQVATPDSLADARRAAIGMPPLDDYPPADR